MTDFYYKYCKYKLKYTDLKEQIGGDECEAEDINIDRVDNHIYFYSEVNSSSIMQLLLFIHDIKKEIRTDSTKKYIILHINSDGGDLTPAIAAYDTIKNSDIPIYTVGEGSIASAATLLLMAGKKSYIRPNATVLIHYIHSYFEGDSKDFESEVKNVKTYHEIMKSILKSKVTMKDENLEDILNSEIWLTADKCLEYGIVDDKLEDSAKLESLPNNN